MKVNKQITIERDILDKLTNIDNFSALVERLLTDYLKDICPNDVKLKQKQAELKQKMLDLRKLRKQIKEIKQSKGLDRQILKLNIEEEQYIKITQKLNRGIELRKIYDNDKKINEKYSFDEWIDKTKGGVK